MDVLDLIEFEMKQTKEEKTKVNKKIQRNQKKKQTCKGPRI